MGKIIKVCSQHGNQGVKPGDYCYICGKPLKEIEELEIGKDGRCPRCKEEVGWFVEYCSGCGAKVRWQGD